MKRIWIAVLFLTLSAGLCTGEQIYVKKVYNDLNSIIERSTKYDSIEELVEDVEDINKYWDANNDFLFAIEDSEALNELGGAIVKLDANDDEIEKSLNEIKNLNNFFYQNHRITLANVL